MYDSVNFNSGNGSLLLLPLVVDPTHPDTPVPVANFRPDTGVNPIEQMTGLEMERAGIEEVFDTESATFMDKKPRKFPFSIDRT
ncbi:MAG: hypothetical protein ACK5LX_04860 [Oscillospiraceae bacterium]